MTRTGGGTVFVRSEGELGTEEQDQGGVVDPELQQQEGSNHSIGRGQPAAREPDREELTSDFPEHSSYQRTVESLSPGDVSLRHPAIQEG